MSRLMVQRPEISGVTVSLMSCISNVDLAGCQSPLVDRDTIPVPLSATRLDIFNQHPCTLAFVEFRFALFRITNDLV